MYKVTLLLTTLLFIDESSSTETAAQLEKRLQLTLQQQMVDKLFSGYAKEDPPNVGGQTKVYLGMAVNSFYSISESTMDYMVSFNLRQKWKDSRLRFPADGPQMEHIKLGDERMRQVWLPDTFFRNEKKSHFHEITTSNRMLRLSRDGTLYYVTTISATFSCPMYLQTYPLDTQHCPIIFESFGYPMATMRFEWSEDLPVVDLGGILQLPQFTLVGYTLRSCDQNYTAGWFPCLQVSFVLRRDIGFFLIQVYVPSILIVILSWVSFWINIESSPARVSIGMLTVLTTTTMSAIARAALPRVSYIKAIDVWMIICLVFVFASLVEYAVVNVMSRRKPSLKPPDINAAAPGAPGGPPNAVMLPRGRGGRCADLRGTTECRIMKRESDGKRRARNIDKLSRQCFPIAFILFNIVYWMVYAMPSESSDGEDEILQ